MHKKVCICVWEADIKTHWGRERPVLSLSVHANEKAVPWEWKALKTADLLKQKKAQRHNREGNTLYIDVFFKNLSLIINTCTFPLLSPHQFEVWILLPGVSEEREVAHNWRKMFTSAHRGTYMVVNQEKWTRDGDMGRKTNGVVHRWRSKEEKNKPFVILNAAEQFHLPCGLQSIILSPAQMNTQSIFSISIFRVFKVTPASIFKVLLEISICFVQDELSVLLKYNLAWLRYSR